MSCGAESGQVGRGILPGTGVQLNLEPASVAGGENKQDGQWVQGSPACYWHLGTCFDGL